MKPEDVSEAALELYEALDPAFTDLDSDENDWAYLRFCMALTSAAVDQIHSYVTFTDDGVGWSRLFDPAECPVEALPYLAQYVGVELTPDMTEAQAREAITTPANWERGTITAIVQTVKRRLTGTQAVNVEERFTENAWRLRITTIEAETPDPDKIKAEVVATQKPIGMIFLFNESVPWDWDELLAQSAEYPDWDAVMEAFPTWDALRTHEP